jgi:membrane associated rhomboid family serine protease
MRFVFTPVVKNLLIINIGFFIIALVALENLRVDINTIFGLHSWYSKDFKAWQFVTYMFMHGNFGHVFSNMLGLLVFGPMLEQIWGAKKFIFFYMFTGIGAGLLYWGINMYETTQLKHSVETYISTPSPDGFSNLMRQHDKRAFDQNIDYIDRYHYNPGDQSIINETVTYAKQLFQNRANFSMVGASGAIFGILMAFAMLFPNTELYLYFFFPIKAKYLVAAYGLYELYSEYMARPNDNVAHFAHLAGMFFAFILIKYWQKQRNTFY